MGFRVLERDDNDGRFAFGCFDDVVSMKSLIYVWKSTTCGILFPRTNNPFRPRCFRTDGLRLFHLLIRRRDMSIFMLRRVLRRGPIQRENRSESKMLYNRELTQHIAAPHLIHASTDLAPRSSSANIVKQGTRFIELTRFRLHLTLSPRSYRLNIRDRLEIKIFRSVFFHQLTICDTLRVETVISYP